MGVVGRAFPPPGREHAAVAVATMANCWAGCMMRAAGGRAAPVRRMQRAGRQPGERVSIFSTNQFVRRYTKYSTKCRPCFENHMFYTIQNNCLLAKA
jgi:hypothetical protein